MLTKRGQLTIVAGAPRANHSGAVVLLKKDDVKTSMLTAEYILEGAGLASSLVMILQCLTLMEMGKIQYNRIIYLLYYIILYYIIL